MFNGIEIKGKKKHHSVVLNEEVDGLMTGWLHEFF